MCDTSLNQACLKLAIQLKTDNRALSGEKRGVSCMSQVLTRGKSQEAKEKGVLSKRSQLTICTMRKVAKWIDTSNSRKACTTTNKQRNNISWQVLEARLVKKKCTPSSLCNLMSEIGSCFNCYINFEHLIQQVYKVPSNTLYYFSLSHYEYEQNASSLFS